MGGRITRSRLEWLQSLGQLGAGLDMPVYLVGGPVRDLILGRLELDTDVAVTGDALEYARRLAERDGAHLLQYPQFHGATVTYPDGRHVDVTGTRSELYPHPGALPQVRPADIIEDLRRRDFTINAIALTMTPDGFGDLVDPYDGYAHLRAGRLQALHGDSFTDDPTRLLRAARFTVRLGLQIEPATLQGIESASASDALATVSAKRVLTELRYVFIEPAARQTLQLLASWGALAGVGLDGEAPRLAALDNLLLARRDVGLSADEGTMTAASLGMLAPDSPEQWLAAWPLRRSEHEAALRAALIVQCPPTVIFSSSAESSRLYAALQGLPAAALLAAWAAGSPASRFNLRRFCRTLTDVRADVTGEDFVRLGHKPGPRFRAALEAALAAKLDRNADRDEQLAEALRLLDDTPGS